MIYPTPVYQFRALMQECFEPEDDRRLRFAARAALKAPVYQMVRPWPVEYGMEDAYEHLAIGYFATDKVVDRDSQVAQEIGDVEYFRMSLMSPDQRELLSDDVFKPRRLGSRLIKWELTKRVVDPTDPNRKRIRVPLHPDLKLLDIYQGRLPYVKSVA